ncbi:hypothetical protein D9M69_567410 [compost metagenome]
MNVTTACEPGRTTGGNDVAQLNSGGLWVLLQQLPRDKRSNTGKTRIEYQRPPSAALGHLLQASPCRGRDGRLRQHRSPLPENLQLGAHLRILNAADHQIHAFQGGAQAARHIEVYPAKILGRFTAPPTAQHTIPGRLQSACSELAEHALGAEYEYGFFSHGQSLRL